MRKTLLGVFAALACSLTAQAQDDRQALRTSVVLGLAANQIDGDGLGGYNKAGVMLGAAARFSLSKSLAFQTELLYVQKGSRSANRDSLDFNAVEQYLRWRVNMIQVPVLLTYQFLPRWTAHAGVGFGYLLSTKADIGYGFENRSDQFQKVDFTGMGGIEFAIDEWLGLNLRYDYSLVPYSVDNIDSKYLLEPRRGGFYNNSILVSLRAHL